MYVVPETILGMRILEFSGMVGYSKFGQTWLISSCEQTSGLT
jgi:hypothetical protein